MRSQLGQAPLLDRDRDRRLFVAPEGFDRAQWAAQQGLNALIVGERGQGKTSVLHQLGLALRRQDPGRRMSFVDLAPARSIEAALRLLVAAGANAVGQLLSWAPALPQPNESEEERNVRASLQQLGALASCTFLIDNARAGDVGYPLFGTLRDRLWETPHQWLVSGETVDRRWLLRPPADAFWEELVELQYTVEAARTLLERRLADKPAWIDKMVDTIGTNPRRLLSAAREASRDDTQPATVVQAWEDWRGRLAGLDRRSSILIAELSGRRPVSASDPDLLESLGWARTTLIKSLEHLEREGLVESWNEPRGTGRPRRLFTTTEPGKHRRG